MTLIDRLFEKTIPEPNSGCLLWLGSCNEDGYGSIRIGGKRGRMLRVHRVAFEHFIGPIPSGMEIDHKCRVRCCVNPDHLEPVTHQENCCRAAAAGTYGTNNKRKTHCPRGHPYEGDNLYLAPNGNRQCVTCRAQYMRQYFINRRAAQ